VTQVARSIDSLRNECDQRHKHARKCQKHPDECRQCVENIKWFGELPAATLSKLLED
jgi:hypothetical protein